MAYLGDEIDDFNLTSLRNRVENHLLHRSKLGIAKAAGDASNAGAGDNVFIAKDALGLGGALGEPLCHLGSLINEILVAVLLLMVARVSAKLRRIDWGRKCPGGIALGDIVGAHLRNEMTDVER